MSVTHSRSPSWTKIRTSACLCVCDNFHGANNGHLEATLVKVVDIVVWTPYLALVSSTSLNHAPSISGSSWSIFWRSSAQLNAIFSPPECVTKCSTYPAIFQPYPLPCTAGANILISYKQRARRTIGSDDPKQKVQKQADGTMECGKAAASVTTKQRPL